MAASKRADWGQYDMGQCITLSLSNIDTNEPMLIAASYFWSDVLNAFLFSHGLMTPTLADLVMLTGLDITTADLMLNKPSFKIDCKSIGSCKGYILKYA
jgi:hypothetical protein